MRVRHLFALLALVRAGAAIALAEPTPAPEAAPKVLQYDDIVLFNKQGGYSVVKETHFQRLIDKGDLVPAPPPSRTLHVQPRDPRRQSQLEGRDGSVQDDQNDCEKSNEVQVVSEQHFLGWDVAMSPVVAALAASATANVMQGYQISNYIGVSGTGTASILIVSVALGVSYMRQWTSTQQINFLFQVPAGNYGVVVSEPWTRRIEGFLLTGCTDNPDNLSFRSDSYTDKNYGNLGWVDGTIRICLSTVYPIPFCIGQGSHY